MAAAASAPGSENNAAWSMSASVLSTTPVRARKLRSCMVCRNRKVRCDKQSPCSNCRRANLACVLPYSETVPRWARRLERSNNAAASNILATQDADASIDKVMDKVRFLENLVKDLSGQLEQAHAAARSGYDGSSRFTSLEKSAHNPTPDQHESSSLFTNTITNVDSQFGRLVLQDASRSRYMSSGFWSRINDEASQPILVKRSSSYDGSLTSA